MTIEIVNLTDSDVQIKNFSKQRYVDDQVVDREWNELWRNTWLVAGVASDVQNPGDYFLFDLGREEILVTCSSLGQVQGFYNVCQHRGNRLVTEQKGSAANYRCAYHAWTYDIDGELKVIPYEERFAEPVDCAARSLQKVHTDVWAGMVFVHLGYSPPPLLEFLGPVVEHLGPYHFEQMTLVEDQTVHLNCNWKAVVDNFSELYHVDFLHPQHRRMVDCCNDTVHLFEHGHTGLAVPGATFNPRFAVPGEPTDIHAAQLKGIGLDPKEFVDRVPEIRRAVQLQKRKVGLEMGFDYGELSDEQLSDVWQYNLFPNVILSFTPGHLWLMRPRPHDSDPGRCEFDKFSLLMFANPELGGQAGDRDDNVDNEKARSHVSMPGTKPADYVRPERDVFGYGEVVAGHKTMTDTIDQDVELLGGVQAGMASAGFDTTCLNDDEMRIQHFHNEWQRIVGVD
jgi:nitrite reductase/ring-hydroxylating ferredoxin subunit